MQLCQHTLRAWLDDRNTLTDKEAGVVSEADNFAVFRQILLGVSYIHSQGIIHRDLKRRT
jgi:serine/threonine protein kinase